MTRFCNTKTPRLLAGIVTLLGVVAPATTVTAQAEVDPVAVFPVPGWSGAVERSIHNWNSTYGATVQVHRTQIITHTHIHPRRSIPSVSLEGVDARVILIVIERRLIFLQVPRYSRYCATEYHRTARYR